MLLMLAWTPAAAAAQADSVAPRHQLTAGVGVSQVTRRDDAASPNSYVGAGASVALGYERTSAYGVFRVTADVQRVRLSPARQVPGRSPEQLLGDGNLRIAIGKPVGASAALGRGLDLGVAVAARVLVAQHHYSDPGQSTHEFGLALLSIAPMVVWRQSIGRGLLALRASVPLVTILERPYADLSLGRHELRLEFVPLARVRQLDGEISYFRHIRPRMAIHGAYQLDVLRLRDLQPLRSASQVLRLGIAWCTSVSC